MDKHIILPAIASVGLVSAILLLVQPFPILSAPSNGNEGLHIVGEYTVQVTGPDGQVKEERHVKNLIVDTGFEGIGNAVFGASTGITSNTYNYVALGTGTTGAASGNTALETELAGAPYARKQVVTPTYDDATNKVTISASWNEAFSCTCTESGVFDASTTGDMMSRQTFSAVNKGTGDTLTITWTYTLS